MAYTTIDDPSAHFQTAIYTGNGDHGHAITNDGNSDLQPDLLWIKNRGRAESNVIYDTSRSTSGGDMHMIFPDLTLVEAVDGDGSASSFDSDGFTVGANAYRANYDGDTFVGWQWKANGGSTSSDTNGNLTSTVQANTTAGFSIVTFDMDGLSGDKTIGHGLGKVPGVIIFKNREDARNWAIHHHSHDPPQYMVFDNDAVASSDNFNNSTDPTSTVFSLEVSWHGAHENIAYCFAEIQGYSKFGIYTGNGDADGAFVYTGFKPAWVLIKNSGADGFNWVLQDTTRSPFNLADNKLNPDSSAAEQTDYDKIDILSNGFKARVADAGCNADASTYIYMAFAEQPFVTSSGVPATAR